MRRRHRHCIQFSGLLLRDRGKKQKKRGREAEQESKRARERQTRAPVMPHYRRAGSTLKFMSTAQPLTIKALKATVGSWGDVARSLNLRLKNSQGVFLTPTGTEKALSKYARGVLRSSLMRKTIEQAVELVGSAGVGDSSDLQLDNKDDEEEDEGEDEEDEEDEGEEENEGEGKHPFQSVDGVRVDELGRSVAALVNWGQEHAWEPFEKMEEHAACDEFLLRLHAGDPGLRVWGCDTIIFPLSYMQGVPIGVSIRIKPEKLSDSNGPVWICNADQCQHQYQSRSSLRRHQKQHGRPIAGLDAKSTAHTHTHTHTHTYTHTHTHTRTHRYTETDTHTHTRARATHTRTRTHAQDAHSD